MTIVYADAPDLTARDFVDVLERSGLAARRPVDEPDRIADMLANADLIIAARDSAADGALVGVARSVTDYAFCCYCSDLAVDKAYHGRGLGRALIAATRRRLQPGCRFHLISAPGVESFYEHIGMNRLTSAFRWPEEP
ncbi:MAG: GNAT family N-acetyltransferase [Caulobacterales bacterium]|nr:GNAT family N-acetyltransferase [Caulobacterales bacterium]